MSQQQPGWGAPPQQFPPPPQPRKSNAGKAIGFSCLGVVALVIFISVIVAVVSSGGGDGNDKARTGKTPGTEQPSKISPKCRKWIKKELGNTNTDNIDAEAGYAVCGDLSDAEMDKAIEDVTDDLMDDPTAAKPGDDEPKEKPNQAVFKVWGSAPGGVDTTYGTDSDNIQGKGLPMTKKMELNDEALYYQVTAQLQGGGDIRCSVTINGKTKKGHANGGYNICSAQLNGDFLGGWS